MTNVTYEQLSALSLDARTKMLAEGRKNVEEKVAKLHELRMSLEETNRKAESVKA